MPKTEHEVVVAYDEWGRNCFQLECSCGWVGDQLHRSSLAELSDEAQKHLTEAAANA